MMINCIIIDIDFKEITLLSRYF